MQGKIIANPADTFLKMSLWSVEALKGVDQTNGLDASGRGIGRDQKAAHEN
jgi:hypothetical protein